MSVVAVAIGLIVRDGRWFLQRRDPSAAFLPGLWEFPGGKVEPGEAAAEALRRELREELAWVTAGLDPLVPIEHAYADRTVVLHPFRCEGPGQPRTRLAWGWFTPDEIARLPVPEATRRLLRALQVS
jgi:mutator protein MutT